jgi:hypothetical protein
LLFPFALKVEIRSKRRIASAFHWRCEGERNVNVAAFPRITSGSAAENPKLTDGVIRDAGKKQASATTALG